MRHPRLRQDTLLALVAAALGIAYAALSAYWALGGRGLLDTVGNGVGRDAGTAARLGLWAVVALKLVAAGLPLAALGTA